MLLSASAFAHAVGSREPAATAPEQAIFSTPAGHFAHFFVTFIGLPQFGQNLVPCGTGVLHFGHGTVAPAVGGGHCGAHVAEVL